MDVADYVAEIRQQILDTPQVVSHSFGYEDRPPLRATLNPCTRVLGGDRIYRLVEARGFFLPFSGARSSVPVVEVSACDPLPSMPWLG